MQEIKGSFNIQISGNRNIVTNDPLLALVSNCKDLGSFLKEIESYKDNLKKEKSRIINMIFSLSIPLLWSFIGFLAALNINSIKCTAISVAFTIILAIFLSKQFKKLEGLSLKIRSAEELLVEIYKLILLDKIKKDNQPNTND